MNSTRIAPSDPDRINLGLSSETFGSIDAGRAMRAGLISRNTWIAEAIEEKLARETLGASSAMDGARNG